MASTRFFDAANMSGVRPCVVVARVHVGAAVEQRLHRVGIARLRCEMQRLYAGVRHRPRLAAGFEQPRDDRRCPRELARCSGV